MLPDRHYQLLTAYVDGELNTRQRKLALRLVERSSEARVLLKMLQEDAKWLKSLPREQLGADFPGDVLRRIAEIQAARKPAPRSAAGRSLGTWMRVAAAAAILMVVGAFSYWLSASKKEAPAQLAKNSTAKKKSPDTKKKGTLPRTVAHANPPKKQVVDGPPVTVGPKVAKNIQPNKVAEPSTRVTVADLHQEKTQVRLATDLKTKNAIHLEFVCRSNAQAVDRIDKVLRNNGVDVLVDASARAKLRARPQTEILVYAENLGPEELAGILRQLGASEMNKGVAERQFNAVELDTLRPDHRAQLASLIGVDVKQLQPPPRGDLKTFIPGNQKRTKKNANNASAEPAPAPEKFAMILVNEPGRDPAAAAEFRDFLRNRRRGGQQPGTIQVLLVLRPRVA